MHDKGVCDFCCERAPTWRYPCRDFDMRPLPWGSKGDFAACDECSVLIEKRDRLGLAMQAPDVRKAMGLMDVAYIIVMVRAMHDKFFLNRAGPRASISPKESRIPRGPSAPSPCLWLPVAVVAPSPKWAPRGSLADLGDIIRPLPAVVRSSNGLKLGK